MGALKENEKSQENLVEENKQETDQEAKEEIKELTPEEKIAELEDKVARTFAEMENQRRRFEKEKEDAFEYGGYSFAKEALNLIDNLDRSKHVLESNKKLDPNFHQAMIEIEDDTKEPGTIIQEIQKGFTIKDRLLRPSLVGVSKKAIQKDEKN